MGWFENQIEERRKADQQLLEDSFLDVASVVIGKNSGEALTDKIITGDTIDDIMKYYHYKPVDIPEGITDNEKKLDYCLRYHGIMKREVELEDLFSQRKTERRLF